MLAPGIIVQRLLRFPFGMEIVDRRAEVLCCWRSVFLVHLARSPLRLNAVRGVLACLASRSKQMETVISFAVMSSSTWSHYCPNSDRGAENFEASTVAVRAPLLGGRCQAVQLWVLLIKSVGMLPASRSANKARLYCFSAHRVYMLN